LVGSRRAEKNRAGLITPHFIRLEDAVNIGPFWLEGVDARELQVDRDTL
jgi:hypothetical protein